MTDTSKTILEAINYFQATDTSGPPSSVVGTISGDYLTGGVAQFTASSNGSTTTSRTLARSCEVCRGRGKSSEYHKGRPKSLEQRAKMSASGKAWRQRKRELISNG